MSALLCPSCDSASAGFSFRKSSVGERFQSIQSFQCTQPLSRVPDYSAAVKGLLDRVEDHFKKLMSDIERTSILPRHSELPINLLNQASFQRDSARTQLGWLEDGTFADLVVASETITTWLKDNYDHLRSQAHNANTCLIEILPTIDLTCAPRPLHALRICESCFDYFYDNEPAWDSMPEEIIVAAISNSRSNRLLTGFATTLSTVIGRMRGSGIALTANSLVERQKYMRPCDCLSFDPSHMRQVQPHLPYPGLPSDPNPNVGARELRGSGGSVSPTEDQVIKGLSEIEGKVFHSMLLHHAVWGL